MAPPHGTAGGAETRDRHERRPVCCGAGTVPGTWHAMPSVDVDAALSLSLSALVKEAPPLINPPCDAQE
jgi:hypothetical protein